MTNLLSEQKQRLNRFGRADEGQALVLTALGLVVLMLMAGLGVDVGYLRYEKQRMQKAADSGALAGATALDYGGNWSAAGQNDTAANGFTNGSNGIVVAVNDPPTEGGFAGQDGYVEVIVSQPRPAFFMKVGGFDTVAVRARAVASAKTAAAGCVWVMDPNAQSSYMATGGALVAASCAIYVNSTSPNAFDQNGTGCTRANGIGIVGGIKSDSCSQPATPSTGIPTQADPLAGVLAPDPNSLPCTPQSGKITGGTVTLSPGKFCGGIQISGTSPNVTFSPGLYILYGGGLQVTSSTAVLSTGAGNAASNGVTFYNTGTSGGSSTGFTAIGINGGTITLTAPTNGPYAGMLFFEDRHPLGSGAINNSLVGGAGSTFNGALYFLTSNLTYAGSSASNGYTVIVANQVKFTGNTTLSSDFSSLTGGPLIHGSALVE